MPFGNSRLCAEAADRAVLRGKPSKQTARAIDGKAFRRRRNPRGVTKWGPAVMTDQPPQGRFSGLRSGFPSEMARAAAAGSEFPNGIRLKPNPTYYHVPGTVRILRSL